MKLSREGQRGIQITRCADGIRRELSGTSEVRRTFVVVQELPTLDVEWNKAVEEHGLQPLLINIGLSGLFFYIYNEFAFAFTAAVGAVTSSVLNTAKRVIIIVVSTIVFQEPMERNTVLGSAIAIGGTFGYSLASKKKPKVSKEKKA